MNALSNSPTLSLLHVLGQGSKTQQKHTTRNIKLHGNQGCKTVNKTKQGQENKVIMDITSHNLAFKWTNRIKWMDHKRQNSQDMPSKSLKFLGNCISLKYSSWSKHNHKLAYCFTSPPLKIHAHKNQEDLLGWNGAMGKGKEHIRISKATPMKHERAMGNDHISKHENQPKTSDSVNFAEFSLLWCNFSVFWM